MFPGATGEESNAFADKVTDSMGRGLPSLCQIQRHLRKHCAPAEVSVAVVNDKEWRAHLESTKLHQGHMEEALPDSSEKISKLGAELTTTLEKIETRERSLNSQFEHVGKEYSACKDELGRIKQAYDGSTKTVTRNQNILQTITDELEEVKAQMDDRGNSMNDTSPLVQIKDALARIKKEIRQMELRIGVSEHSLTHARLKSKTASMLRVGDDGQYETIRSAVANASGASAGQQIY